MMYVIYNPIDSFEGHHIPVVSRNTILLVSRGVANKEDRSKISAQQVFPDPCVVTWVIAQCSSKEPVDIVDDGQPLALLSGESLRA